MSRRRLLPILTAATGLSAFALVSPATAGCGGCRPACEASARFGPSVVYGPAVPCVVRIYPLQPVYRVEQGPIYNVVVVPYDPPRLRFASGPPRFYADCGCYR